MPLLQVAKFTEYALRSLACLARSQQRMSVREIAEQEQIRSASLAKVLHSLSCRGLVRSVRGRGGGFWLARKPEEIRVEDVVEIFQGPLSVAASEPGGAFPAVWETLSAPTRRSLERLTLDDLLRWHADPPHPQQQAEPRPGPSRTRHLADEGREE